MGRPTILDEDLTRRLVAAARRGGSLRACAESAGIERHSISNWCKRGKTGEEPYAAFYARFKKAQGQAQMRAVKRIQDAMGETWQAAAWWLERRYHKDWGRKDQVTQKTALTKSGDMSDAEYRRLLQEELARVDAKMSA